MFVYLFYICSPSLYGRHKEKQAFDEYDIVITIQPTSPLLKSETLDKAIEKLNINEVYIIILTNFRG